MPPDHATWTTCVARRREGLNDLDLVLAIDTTGSMGGVINDVKANMRQLIASLRAGGGSVRVGIVAYRDIHDALCACSPSRSPRSTMPGQRPLLDLRVRVAGGGRRRLAGEA